MTRIVVLLAAVLVAVAAVQASSATFTGSAQNGGSTFATAADWVGPAITVTAPANGSWTTDKTPSLSGAAGNATGDASAVTVKISNTSGVVQTLTPTRNGATWSATAATLADGTYTIQATQTDAAGNTGTSATNTFLVDTTKPAGAAIAAANKAGGTAGKLDAGDAITFTFSEAIDPTTVLSAWSGASAAARVKFTNSGNNDSVQVLDASGGTTVKLGNVATGGNYVTSTSTLAATMALSADARSVVVTLGTPSNQSSSAVGANNMTWTVPAGIKDLAGNATVAGTRTETDTDVDF